MSGRINKKEYLTIKKRIDILKSLPKKDVNPQPTKQKPK